LLYEDVQTGARTEWPPEYIPPHWHLMKHLVSTGRVNEWKV
jgi:hypothetical protein